MKHARVTAIAASVAAATVVSGVGASSSGASAGVAALRFYERPGPTSLVDNAQLGKKAGRGDVVIYANPVFDRTGTQVGTDHGVCTVLNAGQSQCDATLRAAEGSDRDPRYPGREDELRGRGHRRHGRVRRCTRNDDCPSDQGRRLDAPDQPPLVRRRGPAGRQGPGSVRGHELR